MSGMERTYSDAVKALNTLQSNSSIVNAIRQSGRGMNRQAIPEMIEWCRRIGYEPSDFNHLNAIHIAGTKGKGSTSAFISSILSQYPLRKIGLYTSPHLRFVRERIQINNAPLSEPLFAHYFFATWDRLEASALARGEPTQPCAMPVYFRFLTLTALHAYMCEGVDAAVVECGIGGEYDSTNVLEAPSVVGITSLGIDHTAMLGETIGEIAWHKAGVMKAGAKAFTVTQPEAAMEVLIERAREKGVELRVVGVHPQIETGEVRLGLAAEFQKTNASLAVEIAAEHLRRAGYADLWTDKLPDEFVRGLQEVRWGGRCETRIEGPVAWCLDGGHTLESITVASEWFASQVLDSATSTQTTRPSSPRILLFNQQTRPSLSLLRAMHALLTSKLQTAHPFTHVIFCSNVTFSESGYRPDLVSMNTDLKAVEELSVQKELARGWQEVDGQGEEVFVMRTIEDAVKKAREIAESWSVASGDLESLERGKVMVLVTGSLHLVGGALEILEAEKEGTVGKC